MSAIQSIFATMQALFATTVRAHKGFWSHMVTVWNSPAKLRAYAKRGNDWVALLLLPASFAVIVYLAIGLVAGLFALLSWDGIVSVLQTLMVIALCVALVCSLLAVLADVFRSVAYARADALTAKEAASRPTQEQDAADLEAAGLTPETRYEAFGGLIVDKLQAWRNQQADMQEQVTAA